MIRTYYVICESDCLWDLCNSQFTELQNVSGKNLGKNFTDCTFKRTVWEHPSMLLRKGDLHPHTSRYGFFFCTTMKNTLDRRITIVLSLCNIKVATEATGRKNLLKTQSHTKCDPGVCTFDLVFLTFIGETCEKGVCHWIVNNVLVFILGL